jgi:hypothetical protein
MSINNGSPFSGLVSLVLVLVIIGAVAALALSESDLTNFLTNSAKADAIREQNRIQAQKDAIELKNYEALQEIETNLQKEKILADTAAYKRNIEQQLLFQQQQNQQNLELQFQRSNQDLEVSRLTRYVLLGAGVLTMLFISMGLSIFFIQLGRSRVIAVQSVSTLPSRWQDPEWRKKQIASARQREIIARKSPTTHEDAKADETPTSIAIPITWQLVHTQNADQ